MQHALVIPYDGILLVRAGICETGSGDIETMAVDVGLLKYVSSAESNRMGYIGVLAVRGIVKAVAISVVGEENGGEEVIEISPVGAIGSVVASVILAKVT